MDSPAAPAASVVVPSGAAGAFFALPIGVWGQRHKRYLEQNYRVLYMNLLTSGRLNVYLADIEKQAQEMFFRVVKQ